MIDRIHKYANTRLFIDVPLTFSLKLSRDIIRWRMRLKYNGTGKIGIGGDSNVGKLIFLLLSNARCHAVTRFSIFISG